jgi:hypothetical protein
MSIRERQSAALEAWKLRDASAVLDLSDFLPVDADPNSHIGLPYGVAPLVAGWAFASAVGGPQNLVDETRLPRRDQIGVTYTRAAELGTELLLEMEGGGDQLSAIGSTVQGEVIEVTQSLRYGDRPSADRPGPEDILRGHTEDLSRIRLARWVCTTGEVLPQYCNHVFAQKAGLPAALVPESLLLGMIERAWLAGGEIEPESLTVEFLADVHAGGPLLLSHQTEDKREWQVCGSAEGRTVFVAHALGR